MIDDSLGNYRIYIDGSTFSGKTGFVITYNDVVDSVTNQNVVFNGGGQNNPKPEIRFYKSRFNNAFHLGITTFDMQSIGSSHILRVKNGKEQWKYYTGIGPANYFSRLHEDEKGNVYYVAREYAGIYSEGVSIVDSTGTDTNKGFVFATGTASNSSPSFTVHVSHSNNSFFSITGGPMPSNPITIGSINSPPTCSLAMPGGTLAGASPQATLSLPKTANAALSYPSYTTSSYVLSFSLAENYCDVVSVTETEFPGDVVLGPNPVSNDLAIQLSKGSIHSVSIYNSDGQQIYSHIFNHVIKAEVNMELFPPGIFFVRVNSSEGMIIRKVIKE